MPVLDVSELNTVLGVLGMRDVQSQGIGGFENGLWCTLTANRRIHYSIWSYLGQNQASMVSGRSS
jgi:hypothetical protein